MYLKQIYYIPVIVYIQLIHLQLLSTTNLYYLLLHFMSYVLILLSFAWFDFVFIGRIFNEHCWKKSEIQKVFISNNCFTVIVVHMIINNLKHMWQLNLKCFI